MQHLPDDTFAVQPVYLDHQPLQMHPSPSVPGVSAFEIIKASLAKVTSAPHR